MYEKRQFQSLGVKTVSGVAFKIYAISKDGHIDVNLDKTASFIQSTVNDLSGGRFACREAGYLIYHAGERAEWLLVRLWLQDDILAGRVGVYEDGGIAAQSDIIECVWEAVVAAHERDAWVRCMMSDEPDVTAYLDDQLPDGAY